MDEMYKLACEKVPNGWDILIIADMEIENHYYATVQTPAGDRYMTELVEDKKQCYVQAVIGALVWEEQNAAKVMRNLNLKK